MDFAGYLEELTRARPELPGGPLELVALERTGSTNTLARRIAAEYEKEDMDIPPFLIVALEQTAGRGRQGRTWASPRGKGVYATLVRRVAPAAALSTLPLLVGVGLCRALDRLLPVPCRLKWPNDVRVEGRKIGGVLIETRLRHDPVSALIGFGVNQTHGRADLPEGVGTSLALEGAAEVPLATLTWELVWSVDQELAHFGDAEYAVAAYRERSEHAPGDRLLYRDANGEVEGTFLGFDERGLLRLEVAGRERRLTSGEVDS
jgi:BirA family biotin operon repressor/biotin-[acetyl-CoA-carboxylase] ligase